MELNGPALLELLRDPSGQRFAEALSEEIPESIPDPEWGKSAFLRSLSQTGKLLDVGCGNNSPWYTKQYLPQWHYTGLDVGDYNQSQPELADEYIVVPPELFSCEIHKLKGTMDAVISSHNLEHCNDGTGVVRFMAQALRSGGRMYLSFPCEASVGFPSRGGCLNFHDDYTHKGSPPDFGETIALLHQEGLKITYATNRYQPPIGWLLGLQSEPASRESREVKLGTWWYWGFEAVIWACRP